MFPKFRQSSNHCSETLGQTKVRRCRRCYVSQTPNVNQLTCQLLCSSCSKPAVVTEEETHTGGTGWRYSTWWHHWHHQWGHYCPKHYLNYPPCTILLCLVHWYLMQISPYPQPHLRSSLPARGGNTSNNAPPPLQCKKCSTKTRTWMYWIQLRHHMHRNNLAWQHDFW